MTDPLVKHTVDAAKTIAQTASAMLGLLAAAYLMGYLAAWSYFRTFGAGWLIHEISAVALLTYSLVPLGALILFTVLGVTDLVEGGMSRISNTIWLARHGWKFLLAAVAINFALSIFWRPHVILAWTLFILATLLASVAIELIVLSLEKRSFGYDIQSVFLTCSVCALGLYLVPTSYGDAMALWDLDPERTRLPQVHLKSTTMLEDQESSDLLSSQSEGASLRQPPVSRIAYSLLLMRGSTYYCVELSATGMGRKPKIFPIPEQDVLFVVRRSREESN